MNPINDEMPSKDFKDFQDQPDPKKSPNISKRIENKVEIDQQYENEQKPESLTADETEKNDANNLQTVLEEKTKNLAVNDRKANMKGTENGATNGKKKEIEKEETKLDENEIIPELKRYQINAGNEITNRMKENKSEDRKDINKIENPKKQQSDVINSEHTDKANCGGTAVTNEKPSVTTVTFSEEEIEDFEEEIGDVEDVEVPGEEEVDEIIVPDEAENLTYDSDNEERIEKPSHDDGYDGEENIKRIEREQNENEEENSKSSETLEKDNQDSNDKKSLNTDEKESTSSKDYDEDEEIDTLPTEAELVNLEEEENANSPLVEPKSNELSIDEESASQATYDPLNCAENKEQNDENGEDIDKNEEISLANYPSSGNDTATNDEDDEVQFVETRNSPICIESDDDDVNLKDNTEVSSSSSNRNETKQTITTATAAVTVPKNITVTRTSARKSTAKQQQQQQQQHRQNPVSPNNSLNVTPQIQNKPKSLNYLKKATNNKRSFTSTSTQRIVDCIELLDSSDEESTPSRGTSTPQQKTLQKRTLLAAKGNYYKNKSNSKNTLQNTNTTRPLMNFPTQIRQQPKKPAPQLLPPPTPQSNFLNAVQLQPAAVTGANPPAFSALLSNKNVIIPNAFYGNPPNVRGVNPEVELERRYARWLENFLNQFCKPLFIPTHTCLVLLQRALKYKDFVRVKGLRSNMNCHTQSAYNQLNIQLMAELKTIFLKNSKKITNYGRRFCELTCTAAPGKTMGLMSHSTSGKITLRTCSMDVGKPTNSSVSSTSTSTNAATNSATRKRQLDEDEDEYTPDKSVFKAKTKPPSENGDEDSSEMSDDRKRSLRTKRTKRIDNSFSYNEDDLLAEYEINDEDDEKLAQLEIQRKIEQKRLEAQQQRQQQVKSFESAFIQAFAKSTDVPTTSSKNKKSPPAQRVRLKNTTTATATSIKQYTANNDAEDLLQATWIENLENDETQVISDDDEPKEHRIYKQKEQEQLQEQEYHASPTKYNVNSSNKFMRRASKRSRNQEEIITGDDNYNENNYYAENSANTNATQWPKNVDMQMHVNGKSKDRCVICNLNCQRLVHHYVNEHRGCEVYNSRLSLSQIKLLQQGNCNVAKVSLYKNGQYQYEAFCIFCQKTSRFMFPYWYQHFTMHTGEYSYRCLGCGLRKPTRSLITQHQTQGCPKVGGIVQDYSYDSKLLHNCIEAKICGICSYVQLQRSNIVRHLHTQHNVKKILPKHIQTVQLMTTPNQRMNSQNLSDGHDPNTYIIDDDDNDNDNEEILPEESQSQARRENNYYNYIPPYMQAAMNSGNFAFEEVDAGDDLSFMICGMLDVEMNADAN